MRTLFRATVMLSVLGGIGWAMVEYGAASSVRPYTAQAIEWADRWMSEQGIGSQPQFAASMATPAPQPALQLQLGTSTTGQIAESKPSWEALPNSTPGGPTQYVAQGLPVANQVPAATTAINLSASQPTPASPLEQLKWLGAQDLSSSAWGSSGQLHRVCCEVPISSTAGMTRHFEAVATSPTEAAGLLLTEIRAWQATRGSLAAQ